MGEAVFGEDGGASRASFPLSYFGLDRFLAVAPEGVANKAGADRADHWDGRPVGLVPSGSMR